MAFRILPPNNFAFIKSRSAFPPWCAYLRGETMRIEIREGVVLSDERTTLEVRGMSHGPDDLVWDEGKLTYAALVVARWGAGEERSREELQAARRFLGL